MTAPVRELDDNGSLNRAPKEPGPPEQDQNPNSAGGKVDSALPPNAPESPEPPWKQRKQRSAFVADIAPGQLRARLALAPDPVSEPQSSGSPVSLFRTMRPLAGVLAAVAAAIVGYRLGSAPRVTPPPERLAPVHDRTGVTPASAVTTANPDLKATARPPTASGRASEAGADAAQAPTAGATSAAAVPQGDPPGIAFLLKTGAELMANADVAAARLMFQHAAEAGSAEAAFALAETYDPLVFKKLGRRDAVTLDVALAQSWYEKARNLGSMVARERIVRLSELPK